MTSSNLALRFSAEDPNSTRRTNLLGPAQEVDELLRHRVRRAFVEKFGEAPHLDEHMAFLDRRGALYALTYVPAWENASLGLFLGVVRHVISTQCEPPVPQPDIEGWLRAGRPADVRRAEVWDAILQVRYGVDQAALTAQRELLEPYAKLSY